MTTKPIFIHIPKTGGTSINCVMQGTNWQTPPDYHYRHIIYDTKYSNCGDIFDAKNKEKYQREFIFTMLRHPVDRLISEYYFLRKHDEFMSLLSPRPESFEQFVNNQQTSNYMLKFLSGGAIYGNEQLTEARADEIIQLIDELDIHVGIYEHFDLSLNYLDSVGQFNWPKAFEVKRATINRPHIKTIDKKLVQQIEQNNALDMKLYQHCLDKLLTQTKELSKQKYQHKGDKFDHILPYTTRFCILEIELNNRQFLQTNVKFLATLNMYLHKTVKSGKEYAKKWVKLFKEHIQFYYKDTKFAKAIKQAKRNNPADEIVAIAQIIDRACKDPSLGFNVNEPRLTFQMTDAMAQVFEKEGMVNTRKPIW